MEHLRAVLTSVNRQPAVAFYLWRKREGGYLPLTIAVLRVTGGGITEIVTFHDDQFPRLGCRSALPADGTEWSRCGRSRCAVEHVSRWSRRSGATRSRRHRGRVQLELRDGEPGPVRGRGAGFWKVLYPDMTLHPLSL
jgi:hypothetical protein